MTDLLLPGLSQMMRTAALLPASIVLAITPLVAQNTSAPSAEWRRNGVCYEVFVRSFYDSDGDGVGDLRGLTQKLDYINDGNPSTQRDLGANCIWLMPVAQSPSYHGYDVTNYYQINKDYGSNEDFKQLVSEAHRRGIRILFDMVLNHSSNYHPYFRSAVSDPNSRYRDWYVWSPTERKTPGWQAPTWHRAGNRNEYYYGLFWSGMPDHNLANPEVKAELQNVARFWLQEMGVDGFRLDAVGHFFETPDGGWKDAPGNFPWLREYQAGLRRIKPDVFTIGEVYDSLGSVLKYYPDGLDTFFAFEVADAVFDAVRNGSPTRLVAAVGRAQREIPDHRWGMFLRNHDQSRTMSELNGDVARNKLAATIMLTMPGLPFVYYGEEVGMTGLKQAGDERLRTPMHWSRERAAGFTHGTPWEPLAPDSFTANVAVLESDPNSLLNLHRKLIHLRAQHAALGAGQFVPLTTSAPGTLAYLRATADQTVLIVANLTAQPINSVAVSATASPLRAGRYQTRALLGSAPSTTARVNGQGAFNRWTPAPTLAGHETQIFLLSR
jgi:alpha-amylase